MLLKTVIQTMPSYAMNCFLLPITPCQEIEKKIARFFRGSTVEERKGHRESWNTLTTANARGGMGFRELHLFNLATLAKQLWGIIQTRLHAARILKAKYLPRGEVMTASIGYQPSYLWRSVLSSK